MHRNTVLSIVLSAGLLAANSICTAQSPAARPSAPAAAASSAPAAATEPAWVVRSNQYTQTLLDVQFKHSPESGSAQGLAKFDTAITDATRADEIAQRKELENVLATLKKTEAKENDKNVLQDLEILQKAFSLQFRQNDYQLNHKVQFIDATQAVFFGLRTLLDDRVAAERRPAAIVRLRKYVGIEPGFKPFADILKQRMTEQMAKPGVTYPSVNEMETELQRDKSYTDAMQQLFTKYQLTGWQEPLAKLREQLAEYDTWVRATVLPKASTNFHPTSEEYTLSLEGYGVDLPPAQLTSEAHAAFTEIQKEMVPIAAAVAKQYGWSATDYREVLRQLKKTPVADNLILPFYNARLNAIEQIVIVNRLVTLPDYPASLRLATAAESAQLPAPHMLPPASLHDPAQKPVFVLPLYAAPTVDGAANDFTFDAMAWPMTAHEARPGNELQLEAMRRHGLSKARELYALNSTDAEAWGLYSEWLLQPYEPAEGQLATLQLRLLRAARVFLASDLQSGKIAPDDATKLIENDIVLSHGFATAEAARLANGAPGQASSNFYAYTTMLQLRKDTEAALGAKFDAKKFHDFILAQGLLPPDLLRKAVMEDFVPAQKKK